MTAKRISAAMNSGHTAADVLDYIGLSVLEIAAAAERLARRDGS